MDLSDLENLLNNLDRKLAELRGQVADTERDRAHITAQIADIRRIAAKYGSDRTGSARDDQPPPPPPFSDRETFDGTVEGLIHCYLMDPRSPIHGLRHATKQNYGTLLKRISDSHGKVVISGLTEDHIQRMHDFWANNGQKLAMAHALITMFRSLVVFGVMFLKDQRCERLSFILHRMKFKAPAARTEQLSPEQAVAVIKQANEQGLHSLALAQALQFWCPLRQKDVIGEWVPATDAEQSDIHFKDLKWVRGICWEQIDNHFVLRHTTSKEGKLVEVSLGDYPPVMRQLLHDRKKSGPVIVSEITKRPWYSAEFRRQWRKIARAVGIPDNVKNKDSGAGMGDEEFHDAEERTQAAEAAADAASRTLN